MKFLVFLSLALPLSAEAAKSFFQNEANPLRVAFADTLNFDSPYQEQYWCFRGNIHELLFQMDESKFGESDGGFSGTYIDEDMILVEYGGLDVPPFPMFKVPRCEYNYAQRLPSECWEVFRKHYENSQYSFRFDDFEFAPKTRNTFDRGYVWLKKLNYGKYEEYQIRFIEFNAATCEIKSETISN